MTPKERAEILVMQMYGHTISIDKAKNCAMIAIVNLVAEADEKKVTAYRGQMNNKEYWREVRKEIENYNTPTP